VAQDSDVCGHFIAGLEVHDVSTDQVRGGERFRLAITPDQSFRRQKIEDGVHGPGSRPVLEAGKSRLEKYHDEDKNCQRQVLDRRRVAQGSPAEEEYYSANPENRTKPTKEAL
jgi:hypothetical protein